jgi:serine/threonine protein kinase
MALNKFARFGPPATEISFGRKIIETAFEPQRAIETHVDKYAEEIAAQIKEIVGNEKNPPLFVIDAFDERRIQRANADLQTQNLDIIEKSELRNIVVRKMLVKKIREKLGKGINFYLIIGSISEGSQVNEKNYVVHKSGREGVYREGNLNPQTMTALETLSDLPRHPNIIPVLECERGGNKCILSRPELARVSSRLNEPSTSLTNLLSIVWDCLDGADFLNENGLMMQDISLNNLGINIERGKPESGVLFDVEGLVPQNVRRTQLVYAPEYIPPEWIGSNGNIPTSTKETTYQFGVCIKNIFQAKMPDFAREKAVPKSVLADLKNLLQLMFKKDPSERISVGEAKDRLRVIINTLENLNSL